MKKILISLIIIIACGIVVFIIASNDSNKVASNTENTGKKIMNMEDSTNKIIQNDKSTGSDQEDIKESTNKTPSNKGLGTKEEDSKNVNDKVTSDKSAVSKTDDKKSNNRILPPIKSMAISIEDTKVLGSMARTKELLITDKNTLVYFENMVNSAEAYKMKGTYGLDISPVAVCTLNDGRVFDIVTIDDFGAKGEEPGNLIMVTNNTLESINPEYKKLYKLDVKVGEYLTNLYKKISEQN